MDSFRVHKPRSPWFRRYEHAEPALARLIGFHHAGGNASLFRPWRAGLPAWIEVVAVQLPGREERLQEAPLRSAVDVVDALERQIAPLFDVPVYFFGHSMGAMMAFELTRALRRMSGPLPAHLFVSGRRAPHLPEASRGVSALPRDEFIDAVRRFGGTPPEVLAHTELMDLLVPVLRADFELHDSCRYQHEPPLDIPITGFSGMDDAAAPPASVEPWSIHTSAAFRSCRFPGGHFFVNSARRALVTEIAGTIEADLRRSGAFAARRIPSLPPAWTGAHLR